MGNTAIHIENLSKKYRIGVFSADTIRDQIAQSFIGLFSAKPSPENIETNIIWALKDINLDIKEGEVLGIIGHNGAGKSTLLKVLSRITHPTTGRVEVNGRVASLLEVGTGFHPELTGRENVYMNAAILGMKRKQIRQVFDDIVAFAEIEKFIDTPVKRYSSGMYTRLAFAVAAHLEPEILIVDEVLSVGDATFQKKSLGKMNEVSQQGRTVLFVSHNMGAISQLCDACVLLENGVIKFVGKTKDVIEEYIDRTKSFTDAEVEWDNIKEVPGDTVKLRAARIICDNKVTNNIPIDKDIIIEFEYWNPREGALLIPAIHLRDKNNGLVFVSANYHSANLIHDQWFDRPHPVGLYQTRCIIPGNFLNTEHYYIDVGVSNGHKYEVNEQNLFTFTVHETGEMTKEYSSKWGGVVRPRLAWTTERVE